ncbi:MAG: hypothetical protein DSY81_02410 [Bacillota bacterium]|nr:MAG: hypothetical protein DSY81_02410 [Bacillota bacterium]
MEQKSLRQPSSCQGSTIFWTPQDIQICDTDDIDSRACVVFVTGCAAILDRVTMTFDTLIACH